VDLSWAHSEKGAMTSLPSKRSSGCHMVTEEEDDQRTTSEKKNLKKKMWTGGYK